MLLNKADYEKSTMNIFELEATFERLSSEFMFYFPNESWFLSNANEVKDFDLIIAYDDYEKVKSPEELKIVHKKYMELINSRIDNEINPVIENFIEKLRKHQKDLKNNLNCIVIYWV